MTLEQAATWLLAAMLGVVGLTTPSDVTQPSWRGVTGRLESLEASVGSNNAWSSEEEEGVTAVVLPVSVESPNMVSRLSKDCGSSTSDKLLESDIVVLSLGKDFSLVCQASSASHRTH